jgi:ribosomal protein L28
MPTIPCESREKVPQAGKTSSKRTRLTKRLFKANPEQTGGAMDFSEAGRDGQ